MRRISAAGRNQDRNRNGCARAANVLTATDARTRLYVDSTTYKILQNVVDSMRIVRTLVV
jgi:hypothetical protein